MTPKNRETMWACLMVAPSIWLGLHVAHTHYGIDPSHISTPGTDISCWLLLPAAIYLAWKANQARKEGNRIATDVRIAAGDAAAPFTETNQPSMIGERDNGTR